VGGCFGVVYSVEDVVVCMGGGLRRGTLAALPPRRELTGCTEEVWLMCLGTLAARGCCVVELLLERVVGLAAGGAEPGGVYDPTMFFALRGVPWRALGAHSRWDTPH